MKNIFEKDVTEEVIGRINALSANSKPNWGKMSASQMLAHCNVAYEMVYTDKHKKPNAIMGFILKTFIKKSVVDETPYKHNSPTSPAFLIKSEKDFEIEKKNLVDHLKKTQELGADHFDQREANAFGILNKTEWNNMFYKHLDHHLRQFNV